MLSIGSCKLKKHRAKVVQKLSGAIWPLKKHRAIVVRRLRKSTKDIISVRATNVVADSYKLDKHHIVHVLCGSCPEVVQKLSGSCPGGGQNKYETLGWSKLDLYSTPDNFKTSYGHSFLRSID